MNENLLDKLDRENISIAKMDRRILAYSVDEIIVSVIFLFAYWNSLVKTADNVEQLAMLISNLMFQITLLKVIYNTFFIWYYGATPGKMIFKIITLDTLMLSKPTFGPSALRACVRILSEWCFYLGFIWAFGNIYRQTWHDRLAKTVVCNAY